jgi:hypothetical protein
MKCQHEQVMGVGGDGFKNQPEKNEVILLWQTNKFIPLA